MEDGILLKNSNYCRLCAQSSKTPVALSSNPDGKETLATLINRYLPVKVNLEDSFPRGICPKCFVEFDAFKTFLNLITEGQKILQQLLDEQERDLENENEETKLLESILRKNNPSTSVAALHTVENGKKITVIQISSDGPLFPSDDENNLVNFETRSNEGEDSMNRVVNQQKRGRGPKIKNNNIPKSSKKDGNSKIVYKNEIEMNNEETNIEQQLSKIAERSEGKRQIRMPQKYKNDVQGEEFKKIVKIQSFEDEEVLYDDLGNNENIVSSISCTVCTKTYDNQEDFQQHQKYAHSLERPFQCKDCVLSFANKYKLAIHHSGAHQKKRNYVCNKCGKNFNHKNSLTMHLRVHEGLRPYSCNFCIKSFSQKGNLTAHMRIHAREKPYACESCQVRFITSSQWKKHLTQHTENNPFRCDECIRSFPIESVYENHLNRHKNTKEKRLQCKYCDRKFTEAYFKKRHEKSHGKTKKQEKETLIQITHESMKQRFNSDLQNRIIIHDNQIVRPSFDSDAGTHMTQSNKSKEMQSLETIFGEQTEIFENAEEDVRENSIMTSSKVPDNPCEVQQFVDSNGNPLSFTTTEGLYVPIVRINDTIQGIMPDGSRIPINFQEDDNREQEKESCSPEKEQVTVIENTTRGEIQVLTEGNVVFAEDSSVHLSTQQNIEDVDTSRLDIIPLVTEDGKFTLFYTLTDGTVSF